MIALYDVIAINIEDESERVVARRQRYVDAEAIACRYRLPCHRQRFPGVVILIANAIGHA